MINKETNNNDDTVCPSGCGKMEYIHTLLQNNELIDIVNNQKEGEWWFYGSKSKNSF